MTRHPEDADGTKDWRGTPIVEGMQVIYGAPVGRSIALVEGVVEGFTKSGRVNVRVTRRAYGSWAEKEVVHVGHDRLIVINPDTLPPTSLPTQRESAAIEQARRDEIDRIAATHADMTFGENGERFRYTWTPCSVCGTTNPYEKECGS